MARDTKRIDAKGRFIISTRLKDLMGTDLVVTNSLDKGYLCVYSKEHFDSIKDQLSKLNSMDNNVRTIQRAIVGEALEVSTDSQGRISITNELWRESMQIQATRFVFSTLWGSSIYVLVASMRVRPMSF